MMRKSLKTAIFGGIAAASVSLAALAKGDFDAHHDQQVGSAVEPVENTNNTVRATIAKAIETRDFESYHHQAPDSVDAVENALQAPEF